MLLRAFRQVLDERPDARLDIAGRGVARARAQGSRARARPERGRALPRSRHAGPARGRGVARRRRAVARRGVRDGRARGDGARAPGDRRLDRRPRGSRPRRRDGPARAGRATPTRSPRRCWSSPTDPARGCGDGPGGAPPRDRALPRGPLHGAHRGGLPLLARRARERSVARFDEQDRHTRRTG